MNQISTMKKGKLFVITAPSGAGKTTMRNYLLENHPDLYFSVSATTRQPRSGEIIHKDYHFMTQEKYNEHLGNNNFLEHAEVFGNYYGTLKQPIVDRLEKGIDVLLDVDTLYCKSDTSTTKTICIFQTHLIQLSTLHLNIKIL